MKSIQGIAFLDCTPKVASLSSLHVAHQTLDASKRRKVTLIHLPQYFKKLELRFYRDILKNQDRGPLQNSHNRYRLNLHITRAMGR